MVIDGNNSLKRMRQVGNREVADTRVLESDYFLTSEFVDQYKNEVKRSKRRALPPQVETRRAGDASDNEDEVQSQASSEDETEEGDPTDRADVDPDPGLDVSADPPASPIEPFPTVPGPDPTSLADPSSTPAEATPEEVEAAIEAQIRAACVSNWKAASADEKKKMWAIFDECGIFAAACRHGFLLWLIDMVRSGEL